MTTRSAERQKPAKKEKREAPAPMVRMNYFGAQAPMLEKPKLATPSDQKKNNSEADGRNKKKGYDILSSEHLETRAAW